jgi:hypothetical protein
MAIWILERVWLPSPGCLLDIDINSGCTFHQKCFLKTAIVNTTGLQSCKEVMDSQPSQEQSGAACWVVNTHRPL